MTERRISDEKLQEAVDRVYDLHPEIKAESLQVMTDAIPLVHKKKELIMDAVDVAKCEMMIRPLTGLKIDKTSPAITVPIIDKAEMRAATERVYELHPEIMAEELKWIAHVLAIASKVKDFIVESADEQDKAAIESEFKEAGGGRLGQMVFTKASKTVKVADVWGEARCSQHE
jgi:hypothetical protein